MTTVEKLLIQGIRSFSPHNRCVVEFYKVCSQLTQLMHSILKYTASYYYCWTQWSWQNGKVSQQAKVHAFRPLLSA